MLKDYYFSSVFHIP